MLPQFHHLVPATTKCPLWRFRQRSQQVKIHQTTLHETQTRGHRRLLGSTNSPPISPPAPIHKTTLPKTPPPPPTHIKLASANRSLKSPPFHQTTPTSSPMSPIS